MVNLILFLLSFHFCFIFIVFSTLDLELGVSMTSHITVTHWSHVTENIIEDSGTKITSYSIYYTY